MEQKLTLQHMYVCMYVYIYMHIYLSLSLSRSIYIYAVASKLGPRFGFFASKLGPRLRQNLVQDFVLLVFPQFYSVFWVS